tara:strand:+ start:720 stop:989 length:270 start_codon:yes stop_codon:yes gene_type:complete
MKKILIILAAASIASAANADNCLDAMASYANAQVQLGFATAVHSRQSNMASLIALVQAEEAASAAHGTLALCDRGTSKEAPRDRHVKRH